MTKELKQGASGSHSQELVSKIITVLKQRAMIGLKKRKGYHNIQQRFQDLWDRKGNNKVSKCKSVEEIFIWGKKRKKNRRISLFDDHY